MLVVWLALLLASAPSTQAVGAPTDDALRDRQRRLDARQDALEDDLADVESERARLSRQLSAATERLDRLTGELHRLRDETDTLAAEVERLQGQAATSQRHLAERVKALYRGTAPNELLGVLGGASLQHAARRSHYLVALTRNDRAEFEQAAAVGRTLEVRRADLTRAAARQETVAAQAAQARQELDAQLAQASAAQTALAGALADRREEERAIAGELDARARSRAEREAARRRGTVREEAESDRARQEAPPPRSEPPPSRATRSRGPAPAARAPATGGMACPQDHPRSFTDTWGAPRSGGRRHQGTDIFGAMGGDVFAVTSGTIEWTRSGASAGLWLSLRGDDGDRYWYMHLSGFVAAAGSRVEAGQLIAYNGNTGNARGTSPHIHFEHHPGGGRPVNPYGLLRGLCG